MTAEYVLRAAIADLQRGRPAHCNDHDVVRSAQASRENLEWSAAYAEPGYDTPRQGILFSNWNHFPTRVGDILERLGYELEWDDEWTRCDECGRALRTEPDSHDWTPSYHWGLGGSAVVCHDCSAEREA